MTEMLSQEIQVGVAEGLPQTTISICPMCGRKIEATLKIVQHDRGVEGEAVVMEKCCPEHGPFQDLLSTDPEIFLKRQKWHYHYGQRPDPEHVQYPNAKECPEDCGLCQMHRSVTCQGNIDLTTRCNLNCPFCFAHAGKSGANWEPNIDQVREMIDVLYQVWPSGMNGIQFAGGEPTIAPTFFEACRYAKSRFKVVQVATNGLRFQNLDFCHQAKRAGLDGLYLQFDGTTPEIYEQTRARSDLLAIKLKVLENCRRAGLWVVFVPTVIRGVNDHDVGNIFRLAVENADTIQGIAFQPIAFTGRIDQAEDMREVQEAERRKKRYTLADLAWDLERQVDGVFSARRDFYPLSILNPISQLMSMLWPKDGKEYLQITNHPYCGIGTYVLVNRESKQAATVAQLFDFEALIREIHDLNLQLLNGSCHRLNGAVDALKLLRRHFRRDNPLGISFVRFLRAFSGVIGRGRQGYYKSRWRFLLIGGMHFQDNWNYDILNRLMNCDIHYAAPDPRYPNDFQVMLVPFCAYNSGPCFRDRVMETFGKPYHKD